MDQCPNCGIWWSSCPCCNERFCDMCKMTENEAEEMEDE